MADMPNAYSKPYKVWAAMRQRCDNKNVYNYSRYGGRHITYDPRWRSFKAFWKDMGLSYKSGLQIDRINNNGNYVAGNCRWATPKQQANNRKSSRWVTISGVTKTLATWIDDSNIKSSTVRQRYYVYGWDIKKALGMRG